MSNHTATTAPVDFAMTAADFADEFAALTADGATIAYRAFGVGSIARTVTAVRRLCNCQGRGGMTVDSDTREPVHYEMVQIECDEFERFTATYRPNNLVYLVRTAP